MLNPLVKYFQDNPSITTDKFARAADLPYSTVANLRNGRKKEPTVSEAIKIAEVTRGVVPVSSWGK